jgi:5-hydroxyisourate hydrolase-like protein (transthyretin family)
MAPAFYHALVQRPDGCGKLARNDPRRGSDLVKTTPSLILALAFALASPVAEAAPPGMPDPMQMSGIPRPDANIAPGTITVRCLIATFANPAIGVEVELEITTPTGVQTRKATTIEQGRATFSGLEEFFDQSVVAKATIAGQPIQSQPFVLGRQMGVAVALVVADNGTSPAQPADPHGGQGDIPMPGKPFPLEGRPPGTLVVGALDLRSGDTASIGPIPDVEITLTATAPDQAPIIETVRTDANGRALFENLEQRLPAGAQLVVSAQLEPGAELEKSDTFTLGTTAYAVILTRGEGSAGMAPPQQPPPPPPGQQPPPRQRVELPGPRVDKSLQRGQVRVFVVDANDQPVPNQLVMVHSSEATGDSGTHTGTTGPDGMVIIDDVPDSIDMLSQVRVVYEGAPYSSVLFEMPPDAGAVVMQRVFRPTGDRTRVRSALQIDVRPRENDYAAVSFTYAAFVDGDEAFYVPGGMMIYGPAGTTSMHVMEESKPYLMHDEETPWVEIDRPLEPGVEVRLSFAVGMQHDGTLEIDWSTPFPLVEGASLVSVPEELSVTHGVAGVPELEPHAGPGGKPVELYELGFQPFAIGVCDVFASAHEPCPIGIWAGHDVNVVIEDLPIRSRVWPYTAWGLLGVTALGVAISMLLRRRVGPREALLARRDALMAELVALDQRGQDTAEHRKTRVRLLRTLDRIYRQLEALHPTAGPTAGPNPPNPGQSAR